MKKLLLLLPLLVFGCAANVDATPQAPEEPCVEISGVYTFHFQTVSGTCLPISTSVVNVDYVGDKDCEVHKLDVSESKCHYKVQYFCPHPSGAHSDLTGTLDISTDGDSGTGTMHFVFVDDDAKETICTSDYNIKFER